MYSSKISYQSRQQRERIDRAHDQAGLWEINIAALHHLVRFRDQALLVLVAVAEILVFFVGDDEALSILHRNTVLVSL